MKGKDLMEEALKKIAQDRTRTNLFKKYEQRTIAFLVQRLPKWVTSDMLTSIGFLGNVIIAASLVMAAYFGRYWLFAGILGFMISWFGDSLDGRLAYYRNKPRKWYGFSLDITTDWIGITLIGLGFTIYIPEEWRILGYLFIALYAWEVITAILRYKITDKYSIDSGKFGPTEVRIVGMLLLVLEFFVHYSLIYIGIIVVAGFLISNVLEFLKLLKQADQRDKKEREKIIEKQDVQEIYQ